MVTLKITVPETFDDAPGSRQGDPLPGTPEESAIRTLRLFVFRDNDNTIEQYKSITINDDNMCDDPA